MIENHHHERKFRERVRSQTGDFPGHPGVKTLCFRCRGSIPGWGTKITDDTRCGQININYFLKKKPDQVQVSLQGRFASFAYNVFLRMNEQSVSD